MATNDPLFQPFTLKGLTIRNRILSTSHEPSYTEDNKPQTRYRLYQEERAKGGIGLTMFGGSSTVAIDSPAAFGNIDASSDAIVGYYREMADAIHRHGAAVMTQITHMGRRTGWYSGEWLPIVAASGLREMAHRTFPKAAEVEDLRRIAAAYGAAARRCKDGGLDGFEVQANGHFMDGFWSPATNKRDDAYGGSLDNRVRFSIEVFEAIRKAVGEDYIVGVRMTIDERSRDGFDQSEGFEIARRLTDGGLIDFLNVNVGRVDSDEAMSHEIPVMGTPSAPYLENARQVKEAFGLPVFHAARIGDIATARYAIESGAVDMVGMTRAHMADPHIGAKILRGEEERIRPCVGAGTCIDNIYTVGSAYCLHNPATGREEKIPHVIPPSTGTRRKVVVVGAGPAGLEAARVSAERGHHVVLLEAADRAGGQVLVASKAPRRGDLIGIIDWLSAEVARLGVDQRFNCYAESVDIEAEGPDTVVIATGGVPSTAFLDHGHDLISSTWDILSGHAAPAESILVYDENGREPALTCAEHLGRSGATVRLVTPDRLAGAEIGATNYPGYLKSFHETGVRIETDKRLIGVRRDGNRLVAEFFDDYTRSGSEEAFDQIVTEYGTEPADELYFDLKPRSRNRGQIDYDSLIDIQAQPDGGEGAFSLYRVGDAVSSRNIHAAIYDSLRLCLAF